MEHSLRNKIFSSTNCLSEEQLLKYSGNSLSQKEKYIVEKHLLECELCYDALDGFSVIPVTSQNMNEVREEVLHIATKGFSQNKNWKRWLIAASLIGIAAIPSYFYFFQNKKSENILAENRNVEIKIPTEKLLDEDKDKAKGNLPEEIAKSEEQNSVFKNTLQPKEGKKSSGKIISGKKKSPGTQPVFKSFESQNSGENLQTIALAEVQDKTIVAEAEEEHAMKTEIAVMQSPQSAASGNADAKKSEEPDKLSFADADALSDEEGYMEYRSKKKVKSRQITSANTATSSGIKYIDNYKVVDYSEQYAAVFFPETKSIPARFENSENEKTAETEQQLQTKNLFYEDVLKEGFSKLESGDYANALEKFNLILKNFPKDLNAVFYSGLAYYQLGNYDKALTNFNTVSESSNTAFQDEANWHKALAYQKKNETEKAKAELRKLSAKNNFYRQRAQKMLESIEK